MRARLVQVRYRELEVPRSTSAVREWARQTGCAVIEKPDRLLARPCSGGGLPDLLGGIRERASDDVAPLLAIPSRSLDVDDRSRAKPERVGAIAGWLAHQRART